MMTPSMMTPRPVASSIFAAATFMSCVSQAQPIPPDGTTKSRQMNGPVQMVVRDVAYLPGRLISRPHEEPEFQQLLRGVLMNPSKLRRR